MLCPSDYRERLVPRHAGWFPRLGQGALPRSRMSTTTLWVPPVLCSVCGARCLRLHTTTTVPPSPPFQQRPHLCLPPLHPLLTSRVHLGLRWAPPYLSSSSIVVFVLEEQPLGGTRRHRLAEQSVHEGKSASEPRQASHSAETPPTARALPSRIPQEPLSPLPRPQHLKPPCPPSLARCGTGPCPANPHRIVCICCAFEPQH